MATAAPARRRPEQFAGAAPTNRLSAWGRLFLRYPSPRVILVCLAAAVTVRGLAGRWTLADGVIAAGFLAAQPFTEWLIHVVILHFRPRRLGSGTVDLYIARKHRAHHVDPGDIGLTFVQMPALLLLIAVLALGCLVGFRSLPQAVTGLSAGLTLLLAYEWTHFLIHSTYVPRNAVYRIIWRAHRLHHFKNEHYWFGVTNPIGDLVLRTYPDKSAVPTSHTARTLG